MELGQLKSKYLLSEIAKHCPDPVIFFTPGAIVIIKQERKCHEVTKQKVISVVSGHPIVTAKTKLQFPLPLWRKDILLHRKYGSRYTSKRVVVVVRKINR